MILPPQNLTHAFFFFPPCVCFFAFPPALHPRLALSVVSYASRSVLGCVSLPLFLLPTLSPSLSSSPLCRQSTKRGAAVDFRYIQIGEAMAGVDAAGWMESFKVYLEPVAKMALDAKDKVNEKQTERHFCVYTT